VHNYVASFFTHYDALVFFQWLENRRVSAKLIPVPRKVSTSCGTGVIFVCESPEQAVSYCTDTHGSELEAAFSEQDGVYTKIWDADDSAKSRV